MPNGKCYDWSVSTKERAGLRAEHRYISGSWSMGGKARYSVGRWEGADVVA